MGETSNDHRTLYVGVDGGGTKTLAVITDGQFRVIGEGLSGPSNFLRVGVEEATLAVERAVCIACLKAGVRLENITAAGFGLAGVQHHEHNATMLRALRRRLPFRDVTLVSDARSALAGATDLQPGVVVIAGTGSVAFGVDALGRTAQSGGWGPMMGDEGSGYDIARHALTAVACALDGRCAQTTLTARVCERFGVASPDDLLPAVYGSERKHAELASLAQIVEEEASAGDEVARSILADAGRSLGDAVVAVVRRLRVEQSAFMVGYVGGVFNAGALVLGPMEERIAEVAPRAVVRAPLLGPAIGATKLAAHELGRSRRHLPAASGQ
jgi:N-acetylglucosamine kinase-like BadF-type ATPase